VSNAFIAVLLVDLHFPEVASLKAKRSELAPVKAHLDKLGGAVAEVDHQDLWQRATLAAAFVAGSASRLDSHVDAVEGWLDARFPQGVRIERTLASWEDLGGIA
jgi:uncharacterized protein YlxP (DUF503 family)